MTWDKQLNKLIDSEPDVLRIYGDLDFFRKNTALIGGVEVWISNYPYAYGSPLVCGIECDKLPTPKTRLRLKRYLESYSDKIEEEFIKSKMELKKGD